MYRLGITSRASAHSISWILNMCCGHQPPTSSSCSPFRSLPSACISQLQHRVADSEYISRSPQGTHASTWRSVSRAPTPVPTGLCLMPSSCLVMWRKWEKEKWGGTWGSWLCWVFSISNLFRLPSLPGSENWTVGNVRRSYRIMWFSLHGTEGSAPQEGSYFVDLSCLDSVIA